MASKKIQEVTAKIEEAVKKTVRKRATAPKTAAATHKPTAKKTAKAAVEIDGAKIAQLAYFYWMERGCKHGHEVEDWLRAEAELKSRKA